MKTAEHQRLAQSPGLYSAPVPSIISLGYACLSGNDVVSHRFPPNVNLLTCVSAGEQNQSVDFHFLYHARCRYGKHRHRILTSVFLDEYAAFLCISLHISLNYCRGRTPERPRRHILVWMADRPAGPAMVCLSRALLRVWIFHMLGWRGVGGGGEGHLNISPCVWQSVRTMEFVHTATLSFTAARKMKFATAGLKSDFHPDQFSKEILATGLELNRILIWRTWDRFKRSGTTYFHRVLNREWQEIPNTVLRAASETFREGWRPLCRPATANLSRAFSVLVYLVFRVYEIFVEIYPSCPEISRLEFVTLFM